MMKMSKRILVVLLALLLPLLLARRHWRWIAMNYLPGGSRMATPRM